MTALTPVLEQRCRHHVLHGDGSDLEEIQALLAEVDLLRSRLEDSERRVVSVERGITEMVDERDSWQHASNLSDARLLVTKDERDSARAELAAAKAELQHRADNLHQDHPDYDGTDAAHPAWWRGQKDGCDGAARALLLVAQGKKAGGFGGPMETAVEAIMALRTELSRVMPVVEAAKAYRRDVAIRWKSIDHLRAIPRALVDAVDALPQAAVAGPVGERKEAR